MKLCWICPTWNRPKCLVNLVQQFLAQDYPADDLQLIILDDAGQYDTQEGDRWQIVTVPTAFTTLTAKYNALLRLVPADCEGVVVAEDDDGYEPLHTAACAAALAVGFWCKPSRVRSDFEPSVGEASDGRFHASLAFRRDWLIGHGGWPETPRADFDQRLISYLQNFAQPVDPLTLMLPNLEGLLMRRKFPMTYRFNWGSSGHTHAQAFTRGPGDEGWLGRARAAAGRIQYVGQLFPLPETQRHTLQERDVSQFATSGSFDGES